MNPNNCKTCDYKKNPQGGWCYMFKDEPNNACMQHTGRDEPKTEHPLLSLLYK